MWNKSIRVSWLVAPVLCLVACGSSSDGGDGSSSESLTETCSGQYTCSGGGQEVETELKKARGSCYLGQVELTPGGSAYFDADTKGSWDGNKSPFELCMTEGVCLTCSKKGAATAQSSPKVKKCQGAAQACDRYSNWESCDPKPGCGWGVHTSVYAPGVPLYACLGEAYPCDYFSDEGACTDQPGCRWE